MIPALAGPDLTEVCRAPPQISYGTPPAALQEGARTLARHYRQRLENAASPQAPSMSPQDFSLKVQKMTRELYRLRVGPVADVYDAQFPSDYTSSLDVDMHTGAGGRQFWGGAVDRYSAAADAWSTFTSRVTAVTTALQTACANWEREQAQLSGWLREADALLAAGDLEGARRRYGQVLQQDPSARVAQDGLRRVERAERDRAEAETLAQKETEEAQARASASPEGPTAAGLPGSSAGSGGEVPGAASDADAVASNGSGGEAAQDEAARVSRAPINPPPPASWTPGANAEVAAENRAHLEDFAQSEGERVGQFAADVIENNPESADLVLAALFAPMAILGGLWLVDGINNGDPQAQAFLGVATFGVGALVGLSGLIGVDWDSARAPGPGEALLGAGPWFGGLSVRGGAAYTGAPIGTGDIISRRAIDPTFVHGLGGELVGRVGPARLAARGAYRWASLRQTATGDTFDHAAFEFSIAPGLQLFSGGLFSPWAEYRFTASPSCNDELFIDGDSLLSCQDEDGISVGPKYGYRGQIAVGNTFDFNSFGWGDGETSPYADLAVIFDGTTGSVGAALHVGVQLGRGW